MAKRRCYQPLQCAFLHYTMGMKIEIKEETRHRNGVCTFHQRVEIVTKDEKPKPKTSKFVKVVGVVFLLILLAAILAAITLAVA